VYRSMTILVSPPPQLTLLDGRPSPQVHLEFPAYTDLPSQDLPDGTANVDAVAGTIVTLKAAADRPLRRAWIEFLPETRFTDLAAFLAPLGATRAAPVALLTAAGQAVWDVVPARLEPDQRRFAVRFRPHASGMFALHFEDESGLENSQLFELRVQPDPAPTVTLERPSPTRDILDVLPNADVMLRAMVTDPRYAVRSIFLEYRCKKSDSPRSRPVWDHHAAGLATALALKASNGTPAAEVPHAVRLRLVAVPINQAVSLERFHHLDGSPLKEGDILSLQLCADDFDDVSVDKEPGRCHEIELRIVSRNALDVILNQEETRVQQDLVRLEKLQQEAKQKVAQTQEELRKNGRLQPDDVSRLLDAEQQQQQIRERIGDAQEGLRSEVARILDALKNNKLQRTGTQDRMQRVRSGLDRLAREELPQIEPRLTNARKEAENPDAGKDKERPGQREEAAQQTEKEAKVRAKEALDKTNEAKQAEQKADETPDGDPAKNDLRQQAKQAKREADALREQARRLQEDADAIRKGETRNAAKESLAEARRHQEEVQKTLSELLKELDSFASTAGIRGEAKAILEKQKQVNQETKNFVEKNPNAVGFKRDELGDTANAQLEKLVESQLELEKRASKLVDQMEQVRDKRLQQEDVDTAKQLDEAIKKATKGSKPNEGDVVRRMKTAREDIEKNNTSNADQSQRDTIEQLQSVVKELEDQRAAELDRLAKKLREKQEQLEKLAQEQEKLQKMVQEAKKIADPKAREEELKRLARQQQQMKEEAEELARQLSRMRQDRASQAAGQAAAQMEQALRQLERGQDAEEEQEEALERLDEAQREVERTREQAEEELAREQAAKAAEEIKRLKQRHEALIAEASRIERAVLQQKAWRNSLVLSSKQLGRAQDELGDETKAFGEKKRAEAQVFGRLLQNAAEAMKGAGAKFNDRAEEAKDDPNDLTPATEAVKLQKEALRRLDQLLDALKQEPGMAMRLPGGSRGTRGDSGDGGTSGGSGAESLPPVVQYKLLKALQVEINQKTEEFAKNHPDAAKWTEKEKAEVLAIRKEQKEVADLLDALAEPPDEVEGGKP